MDKLFLLDAYALIYRAYYALIRTPRINSKGMNTSAVMGFVNTLEEIIRKEKPSHIGIAFDPKGGTFRHREYPEYKAQREETPEDIRKSVPIIKDIIRAYNIPILEVPDFEADDVIGTLACQANAQGIETYMMTPDKDYAQLVSENVKMYRPSKGQSEFEILGTKEVCDKYGINDTKQVIDLLGLMGDTADNIPGCPGVGEKTAVKLINEFGSTENLLENTDKLKGALKKKVEENVEKIKLSKYLATIRIDVPITLDMENLKICEANKTELRQILEELELRSLVKRIFQDDSNEKKVVKQPDLFDLFANENAEEPKDLILNTLETTHPNYHLVDNEESQAELSRILLTSGIICFDTETTNLEPLNANLVGFSFSKQKNEAYYIPVPQNYEKAKEILNRFKNVFESENIIKVGQNIKYDIEVLSKYDINVKGELFDTMIAHYLINSDMRHNMDYLAEVYLNYKTVHIEELIGAKGKNQRNMSELKPEDVYLYACEDADITLQLKEVLENKLEELGATKLFREIEMPLVPVLCRIEENGVKLDTKSLAETSELFTERLHSIEKEIFELTETEFNLSSPKQVGEILFEKMKISEKPKKTKTGQYITSEEELSKYSQSSPIVEKILVYRGLKKLLSTYVDALPQLINPRTQHIHTSFNQAVTTTGRLSSSNPNLQNIPIRNDDGKEIRKAFIPEEGCEFFSADYSQVELRIMAHLSGDKHMIEAFQNGDDIHAATAAKVFKKPLSEVTKEERSKAKTANFGIIYGISTFGLAERMGVSRGEAKELIDNYFITYPQIHEYMQQSINVAKEKGYIETIFKRRRYLADINSHNATVRGYAERNAINAPIQGSAADIIKLAMVRIHKRFEEEKLRSKMILQVHDELNFSVVPEEHDIVEKIVIEEMENAYPMQVPLRADCGWGKNWLEAH